MIFVPKIGIITNNFEFPRSQTLITALKHEPGVQVDILLEEQSSQFFTTPMPDWDVCFVKARGPIAQTLALRAEKTGVPTYNCTYSIHVTNHRLMYSVLAQLAGVPEPGFAVGTEKEVPFDNYIVKEESVESTKKFTPLFGERGRPATASGVFYFQKRVNSEWEFKVYSFGDIYFFFKQIPTTTNPDKMSTRVQIPEHTLLRDYVARIKQVTQLTITSIDFLQENGQFYVTDINSAPNFNYIKDGPEILANWLLSQAKK